MKCSNCGTPAPQEVTDMIDALPQEIKERIEATTTLCPKCLQIEDDPEEALLIEEERNFGGVLEKPSILIPSTKYYIVNKGNDFFYHWFKEDKGWMSYYSQRLEMRVPEDVAVLH